MEQRDNSLKKMEGVAQVDVEGTSQCCAHQLEEHRNKKTDSCPENVMAKSLVSRAQHSCGRQPRGQLSWVMVLELKMRPRASESQQADTRKLFMDLSLFYKQNWVLESCGSLKGLECGAFIPLYLVIAGEWLPLDRTVFLQSYQFLNTSFGGSSTVCPLGCSLCHLLDLHGLCGGTATRPVLRNLS